MAKRQELVPLGQIEQRIYLIRGQRVMLDADLAALYGVSTKRLNEQVSRNQERFPEDFMFRLTWEEAQRSRSQFVILNDPAGKESRSQFATLKRGANTKYRPYAFTEHGAIMAASVLKSERAVKISVHVVRAFVKLREMLSTHRQLAQKLEALERRLDGHDDQIQALLAAIRELMVPPPEPPKKRIGFHSK
jgi:hypothetical protein